jgi:hypothetical protein
MKLKLLILRMRISSPITFLCLVGRAVFSLSRLKPGGISCIGRILPFFSSTTGYHRMAAAKTSTSTVVVGFYHEESRALASRMAMRGR